MQRIAHAEAKFKNKDKQQQIDLQNTQLFFAKKQRYWLLCGLALAGLIALLLLIIYRNKKKTAYTLSKLNNKLNEANKTKAKLSALSVMNLVRQSTRCTSF